MSFRTLVISALLLIGAFTMPAWAGAPGISVSDAWAPPSLSQAAGVAYITIRNAGSDDALTRVEATTVTTQAELHTHEKSEDDVMRMRKLDKLDIAAKSTVSMQPGGEHIMLIGLEKPLLDGESFALTCYFKHHAPITTQVKIDKARLLAHIKSRNTHPQH